MSRRVPLFMRQDPFLRDIEKEFWGDREGDGPTRLFDQHFGAPVQGEKSPAGTSSLYYRSNRPPREKSGICSLQSDQHHFIACLDVSQFAPEEVKVRVVDEGKTLEVEGKHEYRQDEHGSVCRHFVRKYPLPADAVLDSVASSLSPEGVLTIDVPRRPPLPPQPAERDVPITKTDKKTT